MKLQEIFNQLTYGELSQLHIGGGEEGIIREEDWPKVLASINLGLNALYKRFLLKIGFANVNLITDQETYVISNTDLIKVETISTEEGVFFSLNDPNDPWSIHTISMKTLKVPKDIVNQSIDVPSNLKTSKLSLSYRADHPKITIGYGYFDPERIDVELPDTHLEALLYFVASRMSNPVGMTNEFHTGNNYAAKYEMACQELEQRSLRIDQQGSNTRLERMGWV